MRQSIQQRRRDEAGKDRRCDVCKRSTYGLGSLCNAHRIKRRMYGSTRATRALYRQEWSNVTPLVQMYLKSHPPSAEVQSAMLRILEPGELPHREARSTNPGHLLHRELVWWNDSRSGKRMTIEHRRYDYSPTGILSTLLAVSLHIEQRAGLGFPGDAPEIALALALFRMRKRPRCVIRGKAATRLEYTAPIRPTARRLLAERIKASLVSTWLLSSARQIMRDVEAGTLKRRNKPRRRTADTMKLPSRYPRPQYRTLADRPLIEAWTRNERLWNLYPNGIYPFKKGTAE
jgi:hypothetical protein